MLRALLFLLAAAALPLAAAPETPQAIATEILAPLLDPAKVATLKGDLRRSLGRSQVRADFSYVV